MKNIDNIYGLKPDFIIEPNRYLGTNVGTWQMEDGMVCWYMSAYGYVKNSFTNAEKLLLADGFKLGTGKQAKWP